MKNIQSKQQQLRNANYMLWSKFAVARHSLLKSLQENRRLACALMLLPASLLLTGCKTLPPAPCVQPAPASRPALQYPLPTVSYSLTAQQDIETWLQKQINTSLIFESSSKPPESK